MLGKLCVVAEKGRAFLISCYGHSHQAGSRPQHRVNTRHVLVLLQHSIPTFRCAHFNQTLRKSIVGRLQSGFRDVCSCLTGKVKEGLLQLPECLPPSVAASQIGKRQRKLTWPRREGSFFKRRSRPPRTALFRLPCGSSQLRSMWWRSLRSTGDARADEPIRVRRGYQGPQFDHRPTPHPAR